MRGVCGVCAQASHYKCRSKHHDDCNQHRRTQGPLAGLLSRERQYASRIMGSENFSKKEGMRDLIVN